MFSGRGRESFGQNRGSIGRGIGRGSNTQRTFDNNSTENIRPGWTEEEGENWLELSGKKWMRYYHRTQGPNKFKMTKDKTNSNNKKLSRPLGTGSSDCAPMIHPQEIKISVFEYPDPEDGSYQRGPVRHVVESVNPFLTATNMLDALKLVIDGAPKITADNSEPESSEPAASLGKRTKKPQLTLI